MCCFQSLDFDLTDVANVLDTPLLSNTLRSVLIDQISYYLVLPNKIPIQMVENVNMDALRYPIPQVCVLGLRIVKNLTGFLQDLIKF